MYSGGGSEVECSGDEKQAYLFFDKSFTHVSSGYHS